MKHEDECRCGTFNAEAQEYAEAYRASLGPRVETPWKRERLAQRITLREMAVRAGIVPSRYYAIESHGHPATEEEARRIAAVLGCEGIPGECA